MSQADVFKYLHDIIRDVRCAITDSEDRNKVSAIIDRLIQDQNDVNYGDNEYRYGYLDSEVYAIIEDCGFGADQIDMLAKLGRLTSKELCYVRLYIGNLKQEEN